MTIGEKRFAFIILSLLAVVFILLFIVRHFSQPEFSVTFFNIGQGDSALIKFRNGQKMLVDCGPNKEVLWKLGASLSFFDRELDYLVISHPDLDHYGGCAAVLERYKVKNIITNGESKDDDYFAIWEKALAAEDSKKEIVATDKNMEIGGTKLFFLFPAVSSSLKMAGNNKSLVMKVTDVSSHLSFLFAGDMEELLEKEILQTYCFVSSTSCAFLQSDILKVGHHGSDSSSSEEFLRAVAPKKAIISVGQNSFGHPSLRTLRKIERTDAEILRTDQIGDIIITNSK